MDLYVVNISANRSAIRVIFTASALNAAINTLPAELSLCKVATTAATAVAETVTKPPNAVEIAP